MTEVTIKNKYFLGHYDYITVWAAGKEYHLKPDSEFTFLTSQKEEEIVYCTQNLGHKIGGAVFL